MRSLFVVTTFLVFATVQGQPVLKEYPKLKAQSCFKTYIDGLGTGLREANVHLWVHKQPQLYCPPPTRAFYPEDYVEILEREIRTVAYPDDMPVEIILLEGLRKTFPCSTETVSATASPARIESPFETLRFRSTIWDRAKSNYGCTGELEITSALLVWHDTNFCWHGADISSPLTDIEWISYDRWGPSIQAEATVKLRSLTYPVTFRLPGTVSLKLIRHLNVISPTSRQQCGENGTTGTSESIRTAVSCKTWLNE